MASLLYGSGLRLSEALSLRVKDLNFTRNEILVRDGKGAKDRVTMLPQTIKEPLRSLNPADLWAELVNDHFLERGVGWRFVNGQLERRVEEAFESSVDAARTALESVGLSTARAEIHEALRDLSRRPDPDLTGAVHHAMGALECTARDVAGDAKGTLGEIIRRHPGLLPRPIDEAVAKMWGYASETARHVREGGAPSQAEAELVVGVAAAACSYLAVVVRRSRSS